MPEFPSYPQPVTWNAATFGHEVAAVPIATSAVEPKYPYIGAKPTAQEIEDMLRLWVLDYPAESAITMRKAAYCRLVLARNEDRISTAGRRQVERLLSRMDSAEMLRRAIYAATHDCLHQNMQPVLDNSHRIRCCTLMCSSHSPITLPLYRKFKEAACPEQS